MYYSVTLIYSAVQQILSVFVRVRLVSRSNHSHTLFVAPLILTSSGEPAASERDILPWLAVLCAHPYGTGWIRQLVESLRGIVVTRWTKAPTLPQLYLRVIQNLLEELPDLKSQDKVKVNYYDLNVHTYLHACTMTLGTDSKGISTLVETFTFTHLII